MSLCTDLALEKRYLAAVMLNPSVLEEYPLSPTDLVSEVNQALLRAVASLHARGEEVSTSSIESELERLHLVVDFAHVLGATNAIELNPAPIQKRLRELSHQRRVRDTAIRIATACDADEPERAQELINSLTRQQAPPTDDDRFFTAHDAALYAYTELVTQSEADSRLLAIGNPMVVKRVGRVGPGHLIVIGARPGTGKTSLMFTWAMKLSTDGHKVGIVTIEDRKDIWGAKLLGDMSGVNPSLLRDRTKLTDDNLRSLQAAVEKCKGVGVIFADQVNARCTDVQAAMTRLVKRDGCAVLMVDYLQRVRGFAKESQRVLFGEIAQDLKSTAARLDVPLVLASQLKRRDVEHEEPWMSDLKETGAIEEMAEVVVLLWRDKDARGPLLGKIEKIKWAPSGGRFSLYRNEGGMLVEALS